MGNWCTTTHLFACTRPQDARAVLGALHSGAKRYRWPDPERWALRAGMLTPTLVQAESLQKYGAALGLPELALQRPDSARVVQICTGEGLMSGPETGPGLRLAWNYVVSPAQHELAAVADCLGGGAVCVALGGRRLLCSPEVSPLRPTSERFAETVMRDDGLGRLVYAFAVADRHAVRRSSEHLLGLYTPEHGWVHMVTLTLNLQGRDWQHDGYVTLRDGAGHNPVVYRFAEGPCATSMYIEDPPPVTLTGAAWPA